MKSAEQKLKTDLLESRTVEFQNKVDRQFREAQDFIETRVKNWSDKERKPFIVLDVDETTLDNREYYEDPHGIYYKDPAKNFHSAWDNWVAAKQSPALPQAVALIQWLNENEISYCFATGRIKSQTKDTEDNLRKYGLMGKFCLGVYCKPNDWNDGTTASNKIKMVEAIAREHNMVPIASIGDLAGDAMLEEGPTARNFRLSTSFFYPPRENEKQQKHPVSLLLNRFKTAIAAVLPGGGNARTITGQAVDRDHGVSWRV